VEEREGAVLIERQMINRPIRQEHQCTRQNNEGYHRTSILILPPTRALTGPRASWKFHPANHPRARTHTHILTRTLAAAWAIISPFQSDSPAFHANSIIVGSLCDFISLESVMYNNPSG